MTVCKKNGEELTCKIDTFDAERVKNAGPWFAAWHKDFNSYLVQHIITIKVNGKNKAVKENLQNFILKADAKSPIKHLNDDTLDNRKNNLELFNRNAKNDIVKIDFNTVGIILRDKFGNPKSKALIDAADADMVIKDGYNWVTYKKGADLCVIANTPEGRIHLDKLIMEPEEGEKVHHINLNPLDNRRINLEIK